MTDGATFAVVRERLECTLECLLMRRLKTRTQFQAVMAAGVLARTRHFVLHALQGEAWVRSHGEVLTPWREAGCRASWPVHSVCVGTVVSKRCARRAVTRNAIRRQVFALLQRWFAGQCLPQGAYVVRLRAEFDRKQFISASSEVLKHAVRQELETLFARAQFNPSPPATLDEGGA